MNSFDLELFAEATQYFEKMMKSEKEEDHLFILG